MIYGAKSTNINSIGVLYRYGETEELVSAGATHIVKTLQELLDFI